MNILNSVACANMAGVLGVLLIGLSQSSYAAQAAIPHLNNVDTVVQDELVKQNVVGGAVAVVQNGRVVHARGYGHTNLSRQAAVTINTRFRWASISKPLTAIAALKLDESSSRFRITDKVAKHVSYWPASGQKGNLTVKQLLSNRSGIIHYSSKDDCPGNSSPSYDRNKHGDGTFNARKAIDVFKDQSLCFKPGSDYRYSTFGFSVVAAALEKEARMSYSDWVMKSVAEPLGLTSLRQATGTSHGYKLSCGELDHATEPSKSYVLPGGGWESDVVDLALFANGILQESLLNDTDRLWTESTGNTNSYRLGVSTNSGRSIVWHGGAHNDTRTYMYLFPGRSDKLGIVVYLNGAHGDARRTARRVAMAMGDRTWSISDTAAVPICESNCAGSYSAVWRKTSKDVVVRLGLSDKDFSAEWKYLRSNGYILDDFETKSAGNQVLWDGIFRKGSGGNAMWRNFSREAFSAKWKAQSAQGYRLVDIETYRKNGRRYWAGLFRPGNGRYAMYRYYNTKDFGDKHKELAGDGLKLIDVEAFTDNGITRWAGVWVSGESALLNRNYSTDDFGELRTRRQNSGWKLSDIERYRIDGKVRWAGIWEKSSIGEKLNRNYRICGVKNDDGEWTQQGIMNRHLQWRNAGYEMVDWERD